jgi:hypothetical protein
MLWATVTQWYYNVKMLWDNRRICGPSLIETSLCGAYLYIPYRTAEPPVQRYSDKPPKHIQFHTGSGGTYNIVPLILNFGTRRNWTIGFTPRPIYLLVTLGMPLEGCADPLPVSRLWKKKSLSFYRTSFSHWAIPAPAISLRCRRPGCVSQATFNIYNWLIKFFPVHFSDPADGQRFV